MTVRTMSGASITAIIDGDRISIAQDGVTCEWGACDAAATRTVVYSVNTHGECVPTRLRVCADCEHTARDEADALAKAHIAAPCYWCGD